MKNREYKFRAWDKVKKIMLQNIIEGVYEETMQEVEGNDGSFAIIFNPNYVPIQYTGLKDKNGKEIYESDIVCVVRDVVVENIGGHDRTEPEGEFYEVVFKDGAFWIGNELLWEWVKESEIIGNIYENPELLSS